MFFLNFPGLESWEISFPLSWSHCHLQGQQGSTENFTACLPMPAFLWPPVSTIMDSYTGPAQAIPNDPPSLRLVNWHSLTPGKQKLKSHAIPFASQNVLVRCWWWWWWYVNGTQTASFGNLDWPMTSEGSIFLINNLCGKAQPLVGSATLGMWSWVV